MTLEQEKGWLAYDNIEPIGPRAVWRVLARIATLQNSKADDWMFLPWERAADHDSITHEEAVSQLQRSH